MICLTRRIFDIKVEGKMMQQTQICCTLLKALSALQGNRTCVAMRAVVYSGWISPTAAGSAVRTGPGSRNSVMGEKIHLCAITSEHTRHHSKTGRWLLSKYPELHCSTKHAAHGLGYTEHCYGHTLYTNTHDSASSLTREQSFSTASSMSSWCPILCTPNFSRSWEVSWSRSRPDKCHSETGY